MKGLYRRGKIWWYRFSFLGDQHFVSTKQRDEAEAIKVAREIHKNPLPLIAHKLEKGAPTPLRRKAMRSHVEKFLETRKLNASSRRGYETTLLAFFREHEIIFPYQLTTETIAEWLGSYNSEATVSRYRVIIRTFCAYLVDEGALLINPVNEEVRKPKELEPRIRVLTDAECSALLAECHTDDLRLAVLFGLLAGLRKNEILHARPSWVNLQQRVLSVKPDPEDGWKPKNGKPRTLPLAEELAEELERVGVREPFLVKPNKPFGKWLYRWDFRAQFKTAARRAGITNIVFHDLRGAFASRLVMAGVNPYKVCKWHGAQFATFEKHYAHLIPGDSEINATARVLG